MCARGWRVAFFSSFFAFFLRFLVLMDYFCCLMKCRLCGFIAFFDYEKRIYKKCVACNAASCGGIALERAGY